MFSKFLLSVSRRPVAAAVSRGLSTTSFKHEDPPFVVTKPGIKSKLIDGKLLAAEIYGELRAEVQAMVAEGKRPPNLTVVIVGDNPASLTYVKSKRQAAEKIGMGGELITKPSSITEEELLELVDKCNRDPAINGLLVQLPLPPHIREKTICQAVHPDKDVDAFNLINIGKYCMGDEPAFIPATPLGVLEILKRCKVETYAKNVCVAGRSKNIGFTLTTLLQADAYGTGDLRLGGDATTTMCHRYTPPEQLRVFTKTADIIISATGVPGLIKGDMVKEGVTVIDVGITRVKGKDGKMRLVGDVDFDEVCQVSSLITPVPGGVGPMTVAMVLRNTMDAAKGIYKK